MSAELRGTPMIYELIESVKESLTENNRPCEQCTLCLCDFTVLYIPYSTHHAIALHNTV